MLVYLAIGVLLVLGIHLLVTNAKENCIKVVSLLYLIELDLSFILNEHVNKID